MRQRAPLMLAVILLATHMHGVHAWHLAAVPPWTSSAPQTDHASVPVHEREDMHPVEPFEVAGATVHGPVSGRLQAQLLQLESEARGSGTTGSASGRALLHGTKKPFKYSRCRKCRMVSCNPNRSFCSGHCRRNKKLFFCSTKTLTAASCSREPPVLEDFIGLPPANISNYDTAIVTVPAPYIGCADIGNRPTGCPARGTAAMLPGGQRATVATARCRSEYFIPGCTGPLLPFGVCECVYRSVRSRQRRGPARRGIVIEPCKTTVLAAGSGVGGSDGSPSEEGLVVVPGGNVTQTWFSNFTDADQRREQIYMVTATSRSVTVNATLTYLPGVVYGVPGEYLVDGDEISEDYDYAAQRAKDPDDDDDYDEFDYGPVQPDGGSDAAAD